MYFASERCQAQSVCKALAEKIRHCPELNWFALIDGAFDHGKAELPLPHQRYMLYDYRAMSDLLAASPFLIALTPGDESRLQFELAALIRHRRERPMLSFIGSTAKACLVNANFRLFANARTDDNQEMLLRFADTRVLASLHASLRKENWGGLTSLLQEWIVINRKGELQNLPLYAEREALTGPFQLSPSEFASLLSHGEPDAIIDAIVDSNPEAVPEEDRADFYERVAHACSFAKAHRVHAFPDLVALAYVGILCEGKGLENPKLSELLLQQQWQSGALINELIDFVD